MEDISRLFRDNNYKDIEKLFEKDVREKKQIARGVHGQASKRGYVGKVIYPSDLQDGRTKEGRKYKQSGKVEMWNMYEEIMSYDQFLNLSKEQQKEVFEKYQQIFPVKEICEKWGISSAQYYRHKSELNVSNRKGRARRKSKEVKQEAILTSKEVEENTGQEESKEKALKASFSFELDGLYQADEAAKYIEKIALLLADMEGKEVKIHFKVND